MKRIILDNCTDTQVVAILGMPDLTDAQRTSITQQLAGRLAPAAIAVDAAPVGTMVRVAATGNVYPVPIPTLPNGNAGETFTGYFQRVGGELAGRAVGAVMLEGPAAWGATGDAATWPGAVDRILHADAYQTEAQRAAEAQGAAEFRSNAQQIADAGAVVANPPPQAAAGDIPIEG